MIRGLLPDRYSVLFHLILWKTDASLPEAIFLKGRNYNVPYNVQIAAQGLSKGITIITHNTSEFSRIPNLQYEDWVM